MTQIGIGVGIGLSTFSPQATGGAVLITDTFNRADNASGLGIADTGQSWQTISGSWQISGNQAVANGSGNQIAVIPSGISDATILANVKSSGNGVGLAFRVVDSSNYWFVHIRNDGFSQLLKVIGGSSTSVGNLASPTYSDGTELKVILNGSTISLYYGGVLRNTYNDAALQTATMHGLFASFSGTWQDNFTISS